MGGLRDEEITCQQKPIQNDDLTHVKINNNNFFPQRLIFCYRP